MKIKNIQSLNFSNKSRIKKRIKFIIIHYTGMQSEIASIKRLTKSSSKVSCHYLINRKGQIARMVNDNKVAWHAGKSRWKGFKNLNENSIGIELVNKGHKYGYEKFQNKQINSLVNLCKILRKKYYIKKENFLGHSDIAPLRKIDPGEKFPWKKLSKFNIGKWYVKKRVNFKFINKRQKEILFFKNIYKIGYRYFSFYKRDKTDKLVIKSFQRRYLPKNVTGKIDLETLKISHFLIN